MKINFKYINAFFILFVVEVVIAVFVNDAIIRPYIGDMLVVILMYTLIRGIIGKSIKFLPIYIFVFSSIVELAQYYNIVNILHLQNSKFFSIIIGTSFDIKDIICYLMGTVILVIWENTEKYTNN